MQEYLKAVSNQPKPRVIPLCAEIPLPDISPLDLYTDTRNGGGFLLESMEGSEKIARYAFIGIHTEFIVAIGESVKITGNEPFVSIAKDPEGTTPVDKRRSVLARFNYINVKAPRFFGGMVDYFAYDCIYSLWDKVRPTNSGKRGHNSYGTFDACFMLTADCIVFDHNDRKMYIFSSPFLTYDSKLEEEYHNSVVKICLLVNHISPLASREMPYYNDGKGQSAGPGFVTSISRDIFERPVKNVKELIAAGGIFQAVISRRVESKISRDSFAIYSALIEINLGQYMYYLDFGGERVIGASPEILVRVEKRRMTTVPIAGTRPREKNQEEEQLARDLLNDKKERAEHTMLVDLARNDIGRVCRFGTVEASEFMGVERFSHVQHIHIVSTVNGSLKDNLDV